MLSGFQNASRIPELRRRVLFTLAMLAVYRLGVHVPTPGIDRQALAAYFEQVKGTIFGLFNLFSGGALEQFSVFSLGIMPTSARRSFCSVDGGFPYTKDFRRKAKPAAENHTVYTLWNCGLVDHSGTHD
jgi:preprotein translocase subunit SecY